MRWIALLVCFVLLAGSARAQETPPFAQSGLDAIFVIDAAQQRTTAMYSFRFSDPATDELRWLLPLPPGAEAAEPGAALLPVYAQFVTEPNIEPPFSGACELSPTFTRGDGYLPFPSYVEPGASAVTYFDEVEAALRYIERGDYHLSDAQRAALDAYAEQGYTFAALSIMPDISRSQSTSPLDSATVHLSPLVVVEYPGLNPVLPLAFRANHLATHLDNYDAEGVMPITAYIFADVPYAPDNATVLEPDLARIGGVPNQLRGMMRLTTSAGPFFNELDPAYYSLVRQGISAARGLAFVTEFIGQPDEAYRREPTEAQRAAIDHFNALRVDYPVLTRLRTFINADQVVPDAVFEPNPGAPDFFMDMNAVNTALYWGCTSRTLDNPELEARLPEGRTYIEPLHLSLAHPNDWRLSIINADLPRPIYVLSPERVTRDMLRAMEYGSEAPPMLAAQQVTTRYQFNEDGWEVGILDRSWEWFSGREDFSPRPTPARGAFTRLWPSPEAVDAFNTPDAPIHGVRVALLSSFEDWAASEALYNDMLAYANTYQYFLSRALRHTLFMGSLHNLVAIGYPDGWVETADAHNSRVLLPEGTTFESAPAARVRDTGHDDAATIRAWYDLPPDFSFGQQPAPFEADGRRGYLVVTDSSAAPVIEFSAPVDQYHEYADLLSLMASVVRTEWTLD